MSKKTGSTKTRISVRASGSRRVVLISLVLTLLAAGGALAQWSGIVSLESRQDKKSRGQVTPQSFAPGSPSKEYIYGGRLISTEEPVSSCTYSILPTSASFASTGGTGSVAVTAAAGCAWTAASNDSWITITSGSSGTGNGTVNYSVGANAGAARNGTMTIAGQTFTVSQSAACSYSITPTSASFSSNAGSGSVSVTAGAGCNWTAVSNDSWITITSGSSGTGNGTVNYSVAANAGAARNGTMTIAGQTFTVSQSAPGCTYSVSPASQNFIAAGGTGSVTVTAGAGCTWTAVSNAAWITITSGSSGSGNGSVGYTVAANTGPGRSGTMTIATQTVTITQDSGCSFGISPSSASYTTSGGSGSVAVTANNQSCPWVAISNNPTWITVTSGSSGTGNGTVSYSVAANTGAVRSGSISIAGQSFSIAQDGTVTGCQVSTFAGTGTAGYSEGSGGVSKWNAPVGAVLAKSPITGNPDALFVADTTNNRIRVVYLSSANSALIAGNGTAGYSEGSGNPLNAMYNHPKGITAIKDVNGIVTALLVADTDNHVIRKLAWSGSAWVPSLYSGKQGTAGYVDGTAGNSRYNQPQAITSASSSLIFVADTGNGKIRKLDQNGASTTQSATGVSSPAGVTVNLTTTNLIYVSDQTLHKIFQVNTTTNAVTLLAGNGTAGFADGTGTGALFNSPRQLAWTSGDVLFIADANNFRVRKLVAGTQAVTTLAGSGAQGNADGACASATFKGPQGIAAFGPAGEVYAVDTADNKIRKVQP
jgi:hypothetical protein